MSDSGEQSLGNNRKNLGNNKSNAMSEQNERVKEEQMHREMTGRRQSAVCNSGNSDGVKDLDLIQDIQAHVFQEAVPAFQLGISVTLKCHFISLYLHLLTCHLEVVIIFQSQEHGYT